MPDRTHVDILLAEDTATDAEITIRALRKADVGSNIVWLKDGQAVLDFLRCAGAYAHRITGRPKLILLDIKMPKVDGVQVLTNIKSDPELRAIPVVMLTSSAEEVDIATSYALGANSYLVKPVEYGQLSELVGSAGLYWLAKNRLPARGLDAPLDGRAVPGALTRRYRG